MRRGKAFAHQNTNRSNIRNPQNSLPVFLQLMISSINCAIFLVDVCKAFFKGYCKAFGGEVEPDSDDAEEAEADQLNGNAGLSNSLAAVGL